MAVIRAKGRTELGIMDIEIVGEGTVKTITSGNLWFEQFARKAIKKGDGSLANGYFPDPDTMLQAYAFCHGFFREEDISVDGDIGQMEHDSGVIY